MGILRSLYESVVVERLNLLELLSNECGVTTSSKDAGDHEACCDHPVMESSILAVEEDFMRFVIVAVVDGYIEAGGERWPLDSSRDAV